MQMNSKCYILQCVYVSYLEVLEFNQLYIVLKYALTTRDYSTSISHVWDILSLNITCCM